MPNWKKVLVSGSDASLNSLYVTNAVTASIFSGSFTGSLFGTASYSISASQALTSSFITGSDVFGPFGSNSIISSSYAISSSYGATSSYAEQFNVATALTASGLRYPTADGLEFQNLQTNGSGLLTFDYTKTLYKKIKNGEATPILKGTPLYVSGSQGDLSIIYIADAGNPNRMPATLIAFNNSLAAGTEGTAVILGLIENINTTGYAPGTEIFVAVGGGYTATRPTGSAQVQPLGVVTREGTSGAGIVLTQVPFNLPNIQQGYAWVGDVDGVPQAIPTSSIQNVISSSFAITASYATFALSASNAPGFTTNFSQSTAATTWSFSHNLNTRNPLVQVYSPTFAQLIPNEIIGIDAFTVEIRFDYAQAGYAVASNGGGLYVTGSTPRLVQTVAATTWSFEHNLGTKYPGYEVYDSNDNVIVPAGIRSVDINNAEIYFAFPTTGVVIANFSGISGSLDNAISSSYSTYAVTASYADTFIIDQTLIDYATVASSINGSNTVFTQPTGSFTSAFFKYTVTSASNARSGEVMSVWDGVSVQFTDTSTVDIGTTSAVTSSVAISGADVLFNVQTNTAGWRIKSLGTYL